MADIRILTTNTYRVLSYMYDNNDKNNQVIITQNENHVGRYGLTETGVKTVYLFRKSEK